MAYQVFEEVRAAEESPDGDQNALLHNVSASLGIICALVCAVSAYGVAGRRVDIISQVDGVAVVLAIQSRKSTGSCGFRLRYDLAGDILRPPHRTERHRPTLSLERP